ncbi:conserved hypothetical protein [Paenibacillus curdlanolyticus YK9]|uniref:Uncharacterized protein n=1 Tax=Paenibacillus curdlanolyticus YK9 TaxID=717606 RepID=E0IFQ3_9BACL|nr:hypothetical protein [Paenibacillus curdlanolyticus]EFM08719.1 conserved hypothetical protein [Paenibacillus curdlanolyticus YK9]
MDFIYDEQTWTTFFQDNWLVLVLALVALFVVIGIVRTIVKWALVAAIVIGVIAYSGYTLEDVKSIGTKVTDSVKQEAIQAMAGEASAATYTSNGDGTFTVKTNNLELTGKPNDNEVEVKFRGAKIGTWKIDETIRTLIDTAKNNG